MMSERNEKRSEGSVARYSATRLQMLARDDHGRFASEFNHFGDGLRVPLLSFCTTGILSMFL